jgi:MFS family permease
VTEPRHPALDLSPARKWLITISVMLITVMQILDTSITNVALPHMQGSLSTSVEETSWVITSYLAANAIIIPATGWIMASIGRRRLFLICTMLVVLFTGILFILPLMRRVRADQTGPRKQESDGRVEGLPAAASD